MQQGTVKVDAEKKMQTIEMEVRIILSSSLIDQCILHEKAS